MSVIISPVEALGLSGAALDGRVKTALHHVPDSSFARMARRLRDDAFEHEIIYERHGVREAVRIMLRPMLALREQMTYVHQVCLRVTEALKRLPELYLADPEVRDVMRVSQAEERWLREIWSPTHGRDNPVYGRLDAVCDFASSGWQDTLKFMEPNLSGVGGIHYAPIAEQIVMRDLVPAISSFDPGLTIELPLDQRDLFIQLMIDHARVMGRAACQLCFVEPKYSHEGPDEQSALSRYLSARHGLSISHADPRELEVRDGEVFYGDQRVDVAYRDYELRDLIALEEETGARLEGMRKLLRENRVVSSLVGDFDHKSGFELLTEPELAARHFPADDCKLFDRHVLWTRVVADRVTTLPNRELGDLLEFMRLHREELVLKPNRGYGGEGVTIGAGTGPEEWDGLVARAAARSTDPNESWVVQRATAIPVVEFPVVNPDGRVHNEPFYAVMGFAATDNGIGALCRVSQKKVVNVAQHGGLAALLLSEPPGSLRIARRPGKMGMEDLRLEIGELRNLERTIALLEWDEETYLAPGGRDARGEQIGTLESARHALLVSDRLGDLVEEAAQYCEGNADLARELSLLRRDRAIAAAVPESLVRSLAHAKSAALTAWEDARAHADFGRFAGPLEHLLTLVRERAACLAGDGDRYDALLDEHEPQMTRSRLEPLLLELREGLVPRVACAAEATARFGGILDGRHFAKAAQWELSRHVLSAIGFDFRRGRLDASTHPFTMMAGPSDIRVTGRIEEQDIRASLLTTLHEGGHGLYDQGFAPGDAGTLFADGASAGMHEGQARLWENHVGRSRAFCAWLHPHLRRLFPDFGIGADDFWRALNVVRPGPIRVGADQLSYHLHIAMRYELETALVEANLPVADLPQAWNDSSERLLGLRPRSDLEGVLQDVHWAVGLFGYFPTYTIGSLYAAQLVAAFRSEHAFDDDIRAGDFAALRNWLAGNVYEKGRRHSAEEIVIAATGRGLDTAAYFDFVDSPEQPWSV